MYRSVDKGLTTKYRADGYYLNQSSQIPAIISDDGDFIVSGSESGHVVIWALKVHISHLPFGRFLTLPFAGREVVRHFEYWRSGHEPITQAIFAPDCVKFMCQSIGLRPIISNHEGSFQGTLVVTADFSGEIKIFENNSKLKDWLLREGSVVSNK
jgi:hypothetical protein